MMTIRFVLGGIFWLIYISNAWGLNSFYMYRPLSIGPQHPLFFVNTLYMPDTAGQKDSQWAILDLGYYHVNFFEKSVNVGVDGPPEDFPIRFKRCEGYHVELPAYDWNCKGRGYSIFQDGEYLRRIALFSLQWGSSTEIQWAYRDIYFRGGELDRVIEQYHRLWGMSDERNQASRDSFSIFVWDNEEQKFVYFQDQPTHEYQIESRTLSLKQTLIQSEHFAFSFKLASNFEDQYLETLNTVSKETSPDFNDYNMALESSYLGDTWALHVGRAQTISHKPRFEKSPTPLNFFFLGFVFQLSEYTYFLIQDLFYSTIFPKDGRESLHHDLRERALAIRIAVGENLNVETGLVNNVTWEPHNIDASFFFRLILAY
ncbi:MAG: DUF3187 family protein [SAR324 cluster bacterium]|nr:DUF3187 family protein [SAR324 cluster bacterium]